MGFRCSSIPELIFRAIETPVSVECYHCHYSILDDVKLYYLKCKKKTKAFSSTQKSYPDKHWPFKFLKCSSRQKANEKILEVPIALSFNKCKTKTFIAASRGLD